jgi:hypothetical protein
VGKDTKGAAVKAFNDVVGVDSLLSGVISSILAVFFVETWITLRRWSRERALRSVLGFYGGRCNIITPVHTFATGNFAAMLEMGDVYAIGEALALCHRIGTDAVLAPSDVPEAITANHNLVLGGWSGNHVADSLLRAHCPGFTIVNRQNVESDFYSIYYECGKNKFVDSDDTAYAYIVKLGSELTGYSGSTVLVFGHGDLGTAAATHFLSTGCATLNALKRESFFVVLRVQRQLGYRALSKIIEDISDAAFAAPAGS